MRRCTKHLHWNSTWSSTSNGRKIVSYQRFDFRLSFLRWSRWPDSESLTQRLKMASVRSSVLIAACPWRVGALFWDMIAIFCLNCDLPDRPQTRWRTIHSRHEVFLRTPNALTCSPGSICKGSRTVVRWWTTWTSNSTALSGPPIQSLEGH